MNGDFGKFENASSDDHLKLRNLNCETFILTTPFLRILRQTPSFVSTTCKLV